MANQIYRNDHVVLTQTVDGFFIESLKSGMSTEDFFDLLKSYQFIQVTSVLTIKKVLDNAPAGPELFAVTKQPIKVEISKDNLNAYMTLNLMPEELSKDKRRELTLEVLEALKRAGVNYGIMLNVLKDDLPINEPILIAQGIPPVNGKDSVIKMYEVDNPKPQVVDDGSVNFYNLNLIHQIKVGEWVGERSEPVPGIPGKSVLGYEIKPIDGVILPLHYDRESVELVKEGDKDVLYSIKDGAAHYVGNSIAVYNVLEINGDINFNTGNIDFNGFVTIRGTVEENFSVRAEKDIEINGDYGIGGVDTIESTDGNIYIRGGVAGKNKAKIICKKNLYVKYLSDVDVVCEGNVFVGFYIRNSTVRARQVIVDSPRGQIVGGKIDADIRVECADIGNWTENRTQIVLRGFNRASLQSRIEEITAIVMEKKTLLVKLKLLQKSPDDSNKSANYSAFMQKTRLTLRAVQDEIRSLESERLNILNYMKTPGEGAVIVKKRIYPKVKLVIQNVGFEVAEEAMAPTFVARDGEVCTI